MVIAVDSTTYALSRGIVALFAGGAGTFVSYLAAEVLTNKEKSTNWNPSLAGHLFIIAIGAIPAAMLAYMTGWASMKLNIFIGFIVALLGAFKIQDPSGAWPPTRGAIASFGRPIGWAFAALGLAWVAWNFYVAIRD